MAGEGAAQMISVPYGEGEWEVRAPAGVEVSVVVSRSLPTRRDAATAADEAIAAPAGSPRLRDLAVGKRRVVIAVTDATRDCPDSVIVSPMLRELAEAGVKDEQITFLVAVGTHRSSTAVEKVAKLG